MCRRSKLPEYTQIFTPWVENETTAEDTLGGGHVAGAMSMSCSLLL